jgi:cobalamin biosynthesis Co2+ chelatase CbiK
MGKNTAASYAVRKASRVGRIINKLVECDEEEITDKDKVLNKLQDNFFTTVGHSFQP